MWIIILVMQNSDLHLKWLLRLQMLICFIKTSCIFQREIVLCGDNTVYIYNALAQ